MKQSDGWGMAAWPFVFAFAIMPAPLAAQDGDAGARQFAARCAACHSMTPGVKSGMGPNLVGLVGKQSGTRLGFTPSAALKKAEIVWDAASLDLFLANPIKAVPGSRMVTAVPDPVARANIVAFLMRAK